MPKRCKEGEVNITGKISSLPMRRLDALTTIVAFTLDSDVSRSHASSDGLYLVTGYCTRLKN